MARQVNFVNGTVVSPGFLNDRQEVESSLHFGVRLKRASSTQIELPPLDDGDDAVTGQSCIMVNGQPRWWTSPIIKTVSGAKGTYSLYVVAGEELELTAANFTLTTGAAPANSRKIGEVDWSGASIERIRQNGVGVVTGAMIEDGALSSAGDITWAREANGAWVPTVANGAITSSKLKPTLLQSFATANLVLTNAYQDVPGAKLEVTPIVPSILRVQAVVELRLQRSASAVATEALGNASIKVDSEAESRHTATLELLQTAESTSIIQATVTQIWHIALTAAAHTVQLRGKIGGGGSPAGTILGSAEESHTNLSGELFAS